MIDFEIPLKAPFLWINTHGKYFKILFHKKSIPVRAGSSVGRFLVKCLNNLNTFSDCQNDECFLITSLQWFITQDYSTPNVTFYSSNKQLVFLFCFFLCTLLWSSFKWKKEKVFFLGAICEHARVIIFNEISIIWLKIK